MPTVAYTVSIATPAASAIAAIVACEYPAVVKQLFEDGWNGRDIDALDDIVAADALAHHPGAPRGRDPVRASARATAVLRGFRTGATLHALPGRLITEGRSAALALRAGGVNAAARGVRAFSLVGAEAYSHHDLSVDARRGRLA